MEARFFNDKDASLWDDFCEKSYNATFLHTRKFLSYHETRFTDRSIVLTDCNKYLGLIPAANELEAVDVVTSHPGSSFGGVVHRGGLRGAKMIDALQLTAELLRKSGTKKFRYKAVPYIYHDVPAQDDIYAIWRLGYSCYRKDLSCCIDLSNRLPVTERRRRSYQRALKAGLSIREGGEVLPDLWQVLQENLARKHNARPVHTIEEMALLASRFPSQIEVLAAYKGAEVIAGLVLFKGRQVIHAQYIASSEAGYEVSALDFLFEHVVASSSRAGMRYFDFGISTENQGRQLNESLYKFKSEFGASGLVHEFYEIDLSGTSRAKDL